MAKKKRCKNGASPQAIRRTAIWMADTDGMVRGIGRWKVASESSPGSWYRVAVTEGGIVCDCPYHLGRKGAACKHSVAVEITMLREAGKVEPGSGEPVVLEEAGVVCTRCESKNMRRDGTRPRGIQRMDSTLVRAYLLYYNFIRPHRGLDGITPARAAGITVRGTNVWRTLIQHAALTAA